MPQRKNNQKQRVNQTAAASMRPNGGASGDKQGPGKNTQQNNEQGAFSSTKNNKNHIDLITSYMEQLSGIPLFTPQEELENAKQLEALEQHTWLLILQAPKASHHLHQEVEDDSLEDTGALRANLHKLLQSYRRAAARTHARTLPVSKTRQALIEELTRSLYLYDADKSLIERVMRRLRQDAWSRRVLNTNTVFRLTHADLTQIEQARGRFLRARNNFVRANLRLVISVARNFQHYKIPFIDLIQEGNVGLLKAVHRYDHTRGFRFSTYAHWWIRQAIERAVINKGSQVRQPVHVIDAKRQLGRATNKLTQRLGRTPTTAELSQDLEISEDKIEQIMINSQQDPVSLDERISDHDNRSFIDLMQHEDDIALDESIIRENAHERVRELLRTLNPIERDIIRRRFGLGDDHDQTLDEIGKIYNLSRERVRQIQAQSLNKIRRMYERYRG